MGGLGSIPIPGYAARRSVLGGLGPLGVFGYRCSPIARRILRIPDVDVKVGAPSPFVAGPLVAWNEAFRGAGIPVGRQESSPNLELLDTIPQRPKVIETYNVLAGSVYRYCLLIRYSAALEPFCW